MTTIAYHHESKTIAWDSRSTSNGVIITDSEQKKVETDVGVFIFTGINADRERYIDFYRGDNKQEFMPECNAYLIDGDGVFYTGITDKGEFWKERMTCDHAAGSGGKFALSAMRLGLGAKEAVEHAKTLDCYTGGEVHVMELE